jgi:hypothetical protein
MRLVYIDENGNEIPVSGRPTSAENLPIAPGSTTSTADAIDEVNDKIKFKSVQGTTTSGGVIDLGLDYNDYLVISAEVLTTYGTYYCTPVASMADSKTYARVYDENNNKVGSTSVTIWVLYYKHS